jgi:hypothetical protein
MAASSLNKHVMKIYCQSTIKMYLVTNVKQHLLLLYTD